MLQKGTALPPVGRTVCDRCCFRRTSGEAFIFVVKKKREVFRGTLYKHKGVFHKQSMYCTAESACDYNALTSKKKEKLSVRNFMFV